MSLRRLFAVWHARNLEFLRDRSTLAFNVVLPLALVIAFAVIFGGRPRGEFDIGVVAPPGAALDARLHPFLETRFVEFHRIDVPQLDKAIRAVERHETDLLIDLRSAPHYWVNTDSPKGYLAEKLLLGSARDAIREPVTGAAVGYVDWLLPGILGMNMMFSCLFGVGYVVVRYRKSGFLRRLSATPVTALEFGAAQILSRLALTVGVTTMIYAVLALLVTFHNSGSALLLFATAVLGATCMISLSFMVASRFSSEELASGIINLVSWPMMLLSGVWFKLEGAPHWVRAASEVLPLTQLLHAARAIMLDGAGIVEILPRLAALGGMTILFLGVAAAGFRWRAD